MIYLHGNYAEIMDDMDDMPYGTRKYLYCTNGVIKVAEGLADLVQGTLVVAL